jgi:hypothetical protein
MISTINTIPRVAPKPVSDEIFHQRMEDGLAQAILSVAGVIFLAEVILACLH